MTTFEILKITFASLFLLGGLAGIYIKTLMALAKMDRDTKVSLAEIEVKILRIEQDLIAKEADICRIEEINRDDARDNRDDHKQILAKIDKLSERLKKE